MVRHVGRPCGRPCLPGGLTLTSHLSLRRLAVSLSIILALVLTAGSLGTVFEDQNASEPTMTTSSPGDEDANHQLDPRCVAKNNPNWGMCLAPSPANLLERTGEHTDIKKIHETVEDGGLPEAIHAAADLADVRLGEDPLDQEPTLPDEVEMPSQTPTALTEPTARLLTAQHQAAHLANQALPTESELATLDGEHPISLLQPRTSSPSPEASPHATPPTPIEQASLLDARPTGIEANLDQAKMAKGALLLAEAVEEAIPHLEAYAHATPGTTNKDTLAGCDIVDEPPILCIGGTSDNVYDEGDYAVQIDLGGDDAFRNAPGSADPGVLHAGAGNGLFASVAITLAGNDTYEAATGLYAEGHEGATGIHGAGVTGIGILVDTGGDDTYRATGTHEDQDSSGQGYGLAGVGVLDDRGGDDAYELSADEANGAVLGQGTGTVGGLGVLVDRGAGTDTYLASTLPEPKLSSSGAVYPAPVTVSAQGAAVGASGAIFFDDGGTDEVRIDARSQPIQPDDSREQANIIAIAGGLGQGYADLSGGALALTGDGPTSWSLISEGHAPWSGQRQAHGMGSASGDSFAALYDAGGDDSYTMKAISKAQREVAVTDECECFGAFAEAQAGGPRQSLLAYYSVDSTGMGTGNGVLLDGSGDDAYTMEAQGTADARAYDNRTQTVGDDIEEIGALATADGSYVTVVGQGAGSNLWDEQGDDAYAFHVNGAADAKAHAQPEDAYEAAKAGTGNVRGFAQGASGLLLDQGGADAYHAQTLVDVTADPPTEEESPPPTLVAQPGGSGALVDVDQGAQDTFSTTPATEPCQGARGDAFWVECDGGIGANMALSPFYGGLHR